MNYKNVLAAINTIKAGRLELLLVRLFGRKTTTETAEAKTTVVEFRGKMYITEFTDYEVSND